MDRAETTEQAMAEIGAEWEVLDADGASVGVVNEVHANYLWVQKGLLFPKDMYIPMTALETIGQGRVLLNVTLDQIRTAGWDVLPEALSGP